MIIVTRRSNRADSAPAGRHSRVIADGTRNDLAQLDPAFIAPG